MSEKSPQNNEEDETKLFEDDLTRAFFLFVVGSEAKNGLDNLDLDELMDNLDLDEEKKILQELDDQKKNEEVQEGNIFSRHNPVTIGGMFLLVAISATRFIMSDPQPEAFIAVISFIALLLALYSIWMKLSNTLMS